jgi:hypothetical protein
MCAFGAKAHIALPAALPAGKKSVNICSNRSGIAALHMSAFGTKQTFRDRVPMSAFGGKADVAAQRFSANHVWYFAPRIGRKTQ